MQARDLSLEQNKKEGAEKLDVTTNIDSLFFQASIDSFRGPYKGLKATLDGVDITKALKNEKGRERKHFAIDNIDFRTGSFARSSSLEGNDLALSVSGMSITRQLWDAKGLTREVSEIDSDSLHLGVDSLAVGTYKKFSFYDGPFEKNALGLENVVLNGLSMRAEGLRSVKTVYDAKGTRRSLGEMDLDTVKLSANQVSLESLEKISFEGKGTQGSILALRGGSLKGFLRGSS